MTMVCLAGVSKQRGLLVLTENDKLGCTLVTETEGVLSVAVWQI